MDRSRDGAALALLFGGVALAVATALFLPALHVRGADQALLGLSAWEAVPALTLLKFATLAAAVAAAFLPRLRPVRVPITVGAIAMMFAPALGALMAALTHWSGLRAAIVELSGNRQPWVDPGWGIVALLAAAAMLAGALRRGGGGDGAAA